MTEQKAPELWISVDGGAIALTRDDGESEALERDHHGDWRLTGMLDAVPEGWVRLVPAPSEQTSRWRYEWGYGSRQFPEMVIPSTEELAREAAAGQPSLTAVRRLVGSWETVEEASEQPAEPGGAA